MTKLKIRHAGMTGAATKPVALTPDDKLRGPFAARFHGRPEHARAQRVRRRGYVRVHALASAEPAVSLLMGTGLGGLLLARRRRRHGSEVR